MAKATTNKSKAIESEVTIMENETRNLTIVERMTQAMSIDRDSKYMKVESKDGQVTEIVKKTFKFIEPIGNRSQISIMDSEIIDSIDNIASAMSVRNMTNYIICKEFDKINSSGKLDSMGFKTIGEFGKAIFGLESSTVNHYARIGKLFINDDYSVNAMLPDLSVSHLLELSAYVGEDGDISKVSELYQNGALVDGMSTKKIRETLKNLRENALPQNTENNSENVETSATETTETTETTVSNSENIEPTENMIEQLKADFNKQLTVGKILSFCDAVNDLFDILNQHEIEVVGYGEHIDTLVAMAKALLETK